MKNTLAADRKNINNALLLKQNNKKPIFSFSPADRSLSASSAGGRVYDLGKCM